MENRDKIIYDIPEGYEAKIEGNKVVIVPKESEDERTRKELIEFVSDVKEISLAQRRTWAVRESDAERCERFLSWIERRKEPRDYRKLYEEVVKSDWFKENYVGKSLGEDHQPAEWSEEDEKMREHIIYDLREFRDCETDDELVSDYEDEITWLKSLRPQPHWKPSNEQVKALFDAIAVVAREYPEDNVIADLLQGLYDDLNKL